MVARIAGIYGVKGWVKVASYTVPATEILMYTPWLLKRDSGWQVFEVTQRKPHGKGLIVHPVGSNDYDTASKLVGAEIAVTRHQFPELPEGEYYWADLENLQVVTRSGSDFGFVARLFDTGANAVMVVQGDRERLIPFIRGDVVLDVDLAAGIITVDWDPDF